jgi:rhodanese-related sulfurtransferase|tara:strand:+ start:663 stop:980 length:318 start_codon:yes stop_codon:yes gene_type:complete
MKNISPVDLKEMIDNKDDFQLIDIRDDYEIDICSIGGDKINMYSIPDNIDKINKENKVIIYCRTGVRSANVVSMLENNFLFKNIYNLEGGIMKWREDLDQNLKPY